MHQVKIRMSMDENIFSLSCYYYLSSMSLNVSVKVLKQPSSGFIFTSNAEREKDLFWFVDFFVWFDFCCFGFRLWFGFFYYLCPVNYSSVHCFSSPVY